MKLSVLIPSCDEEKAFRLIPGKVVAAKHDYGFEKDIILANDHSSDNTKSVVEAFIAFSGYLEHKILLWPVIC